MINLQNLIYFIFQGCSSESINGPNLIDLLKKYNDQQCRNEVRKQFERNYKSQLFKFDCISDLTLSEAFRYSGNNWIINHIS